MRTGLLFKSVANFHSCRENEPVMDTASLAAAASAVKQSQVQNQVATSVAVKTQDVQRQQGEAAVDMIKQVASVADQLAQGKIDVQL